MEGQPRTQGLLSPESKQNLLGQMQGWTHLGDKKLVQAVKGSKVYIKDFIFWARDIVQQCKVCQQVNAYVLPRVNSAKDLGKNGLEYIGRSILQMLSQVNIVTNTL